MQAPTRTASGKPSWRSEVDSLMRALAAPFDVSQVRFKPALVSGHRALALAYVDARVIQDRLDNVLGVDGWQDNYECLPDGSVVCRLQLRLGEGWITKVDVGGPSEQPDGGDRMKAAFSDALKRAAVKFGIGRYLYRLPSQWLDYDPQRRQFVHTPTLPAWALPAQETPATAKSASSPRRPASGAELQQRLQDYDARLATQGLCEPGELVQHVLQAGIQAGYKSDLATWSGDAIALAVEETKAFADQARQRAAKQKDVA
jgi:hypothetical protein